MTNNFAFIHAVHAPVTRWVRRKLKANRRAALYPLLCCVSVLTCMALAHPFANSPFNDDWSYSYVASRFAETGRLQYNGWGSPTILFQTLWGAAWVKVFGFSFDVLRAATIPFAVGFVLLVYALGRQAGLTRNFAFFGALTIGTSPLFVPLAVSFMTDVYGCFFMALCVYAAIGSAQARCFRIGSAWIWILALSGIAGGSNRQAVWVAPLTLIPYALWAKRSDRFFVLHAAAAYLVCIASLLLVLTNVSQPYAPLELSAYQLVYIILTRSGVACVVLASLLLCLSLVALPALLCAAPMWKRLGGWRCVTSCTISGVVAATTFALFGRQIGLAPFLGNTLTPVGILRVGQDALGFRPEILPIFFRFGLTCLLVFAALAFARLCPAHSPAMPRVPLNVFGILFSAYMLLLVPGAAFVLTYDRYLLPVLPLLVIFVLMRVQAWTPSASGLAWICLVLFAVYSTATTHDYFSSLRARVLAARILQDRGVARNRISAGFEYDGWTQLQTAGSIELVHYNEPIELNKTDQFWFWKKATAITPDYVVSYWPASRLPAKRVATVPFNSWLPPFRRAAIALKRADLPKSGIAISVIGGS